MNYLQIIDMHEKLFANSIDVLKLKKAEDDILNIYNSSIAIAKTKSSALRLAILLKTKRRLLNYFNTFSDEYYEYLYEGTNKFSLTEGIKQYSDVDKLLSNVLEFAPEVKKIVDIILDNKCIIADANGALITSNPEQCKKVLSVCETLNELVDKLSFNGFADNVVFIDYKKILFNEVDGLRLLSNRCLKEIESIEINKIKEKFIADFEGEYPFSDIYRPLPDFSKISNLIIVNSPIIDEVNLFIEAYKRYFNRKIYLLNANLLEKESVETTQRIFNLLKGSNADLYVTNLYKYNGNNKDVLFKMLYEYALGGEKVFIYNNLIFENVHDYFVTLANNDAEIRTSKIGNYYVALPSYEETISFLQKNGVVFDAEILSNLKTEFPFVGYEGLNMSLFDYRQGRNWYVRGRKISNKNQSEYQIDKYLTKISAQNQFISTDWGNFKENINLNKTKNFDYDLINEINDKFVEEIIYSDLNIIEKCGVIIRYIITGGNDYKVLEEMPKEELEDRITKATILTMNLLGIEFKPEVIFSNKIDGSDTILGMCRNGGRIIEYKNSGCRNGGILNTLAHECYHAFQHMTEEGYCKWFWDELFVSEARTKYWIENFNTYSDSKEGSFNNYYNQVVEADARTFADDCGLAADLLWHKFNFKK